MDGDRFGNASEIDALSDNDDDPEMDTTPGFDNDNHETECEQANHSIQESYIPNKKRKPRNTEKFRWVKEDFIPQFYNEALDDFDPVDPKSSLEYFRQFITDDVLDELTTKTNMYCMQKQGKSLGATSEEIQKLLGMNIEIGSMKCPQLRLYWSRSRRYKLTADSMTYNSFSALRNNLHIVDNLQAGGNNEDKLWKVCPIINAFMNGLSSIKLEKRLSVDEQMIPFKGALSFKQYMRQA